MPAPKLKWGPGAWVFCTKPFGFYTLSACANHTCNAGVGLTHAYVGLLSKEQCGGRSPVVKISDDPTDSVLLPKTFRAV